MAPRFPQRPIAGQEQFQYILGTSYLHEIPRLRDEYQSKRVLIVASKSLDSQTDKISKLEQSLGSSFIDKKSGVGSHSPYQDVIDIAHRIQTHRIDLVVSIGSGSYSDACKTAVILAETLAPGFEEQDVERLVDQDKGVNKPEDVKPPRAKLIVIPTSLSAGEWNNSASATNSDGKKQHFYHPLSYPTMILLDTEIARTTPQSLWLASGFRAIDHCVETICDLNCSQEACQGASEGLQSLLKGLVEYKTGKERNDDRDLDKGILDCFQGSRKAIFGYVLYGSRFGPSHAIGHQLGSVGKVQHGVTSCIMLGPVLRFTKNRNPKGQRQVLEVFNTALDWKEVEAADAITKFASFLGLPSTLREVGVTDPAKLDLIARLTTTDILGKGMGTLSYEEVREVLQLAS